MTASLGQMAKKSFWNAYDHLGGCLLLNLIWSLFSLPWLALAAILVTLGWKQVLDGYGLLGFMVAGVGLQQVMLSPVTAALWTVTASWAYYRAAAVRFFFPALRQFFGRALGLWLCFTFAGLLLSVNIYFYGQLLQKVPLLGAFAAGLMAWAYLFLSLIQVYALALLVWENGSIKKTFRHSLLLVLDNLGYTVALILLMSIILLIGLVSLAGLVFLAVSLIGIVANTGLREVLKRYELPGEKSKPRTWAEIQETREQAEEEPRGWKDLWRPWESREH